MEIKKIYLSKKWVDEDWDLFSNNIEETNSFFYSNDVYEILENGILVCLVEYELWDEEKTCHIYSYEIKRNLRGKGLGRKAVNEFISYIKQFKYIEIIELYSKNTDVEGFWYKCGFKKNAGCDELFIKI